MTAQIAERLLYQGEPVAMCTEPLERYFVLSCVFPKFEANCTALWRGYVGSWEIVNDRLYLIGLEGILEDGTNVSVSTFFPGFPDRVFAHWFSGTIRIPQGKQLRYVHMGYASTFERDLILDLDRGIVSDTRILQNGVSESEDAPEGYELGAMTIFPSHRQ